MKKITIGSLFDGSGGFPLAAALQGCVPLWASEVEPYPIAVTRSRFPNMKHLGNVSEIHGDKIDPVDIITFGSPCFPKGTLVLTEGGYIPIEEVTVGMKVLTHLGRWKKVTATGSKTGETVVLRGNHYGLECTPNHPIYTSGEKKFYPYLDNGRRGSQFLLTDEKSWVPASEMQGKLWAVPGHAESIPVVSPQYSGALRQKPMPPFSEDLCYFIGRWLGDGWVYDGQRAGRPQGEANGRIYLCDSLDKEDELRSAIKKITDKYTVTRQKSVVRFSFISQVLCEWLTGNFGQYAAGKTMPGWVFGMRESYRAALLKGLIDSDGCRIKGKENAWKITTISKRLAESIRLLAEIQGYSTTVHKTCVPEQTVIEGRTVKQHDWYSVVMISGGKRKHLKDDLHGWYRVRNVRSTGRVAVVYNLTVEEDNSYIADGIVVHNCQDMSIAGKRAGLKHVAIGDEETTRSGLFYEAIRIIREMREATDGKYPTYAVWENVPGALSSNKGEDFRCVLEEFARVKERDVSVPQPTEGWTTAGEIVGDGYSVAWRVLDAQYWGVAQRRRRIYLVADFATGRAGKILFEREGMPRNSAQSGAERERVAADAEGSTDGGHRVRCLNPWDCQSKRLYSIDGLYPTLPAMNGGGQSAEAVIYDTTQITSPANGSNPHPGDPSHPICANAHVPLLIEPSVYNESGHGYWMPGFGCLRAEGENRPSRPCHLVCFAQNQRDEVCILGDHAGALAANPGVKQQSYLAYPFATHCYVSTRFAEYKETLPTLRASGGDLGGGSEEIVVNATNTAPCADRGQNVMEDCSPTLVCNHGQPIVTVESKPPRRYIIRRLTPTECARLQGFPDCWGHPEHKDAMTSEEVMFWEGVRKTHAELSGKTYKPCKVTDALLKWYNKLHTDSSEYRMWGNGIALVCAEFVLSGIVEELKERWKIAN